MTAGQAGLPAAGRTNRVIFQQYPAPVRQPYAAAVVERSPASRHAKLCKPGEAALAYMASMALPDYRNRRHADPGPKVESLLAGMKRISMGQYLQVFRVATDAIQPALFDYKLSRPGSCAAISRFSAACAAIRDAIELEARNLRRIVAQRLEAPARCSWLAFRERLAEYRNRAEAHPATCSWPVAHPDYYAIMCPLLEDALVEALTAARVKRVFSDHPVATLAHISRGADRYLHDVAGEDLGLPFQAVISLDRSITDIWSQETWKASPGCQLMLARLPGGAYEISGLLHDLVTEGTPRPLAAGAPGEPRAVVASTRPTSPWRAATATAAGTCGELVQGFTSRGVPFHVTCPIARTATVTVRPAPGEVRPPAAGSSRTPGTPATSSASTCQTSGRCTGDRPPPGTRAGNGHQPGRAPPRGAPARPDQPRRLARTGRCAGCSSCRPAHDAPGASAFPLCAGALTMAMPTGNRSSPGRGKATSCARPAPRRAMAIIPGYPENTES